MNDLATVHPLQGTASDASRSVGNTYPAVGVPRGMTYWTPQTSDGRFIFDRRAPKLAGIRATHSPSPWMGDFGHFDIMPVVGDIGISPNVRASGYDVASSTFRPHRFATRLPGPGIEMELSASERCAVMAFTFPSDAADQGAVVVQIGDSPSRAASSVRLLEGGREIVGTSRASHGGAHPSFACHFVIRLEAPTLGGWGTLTPKGLNHDLAQISDARPGAYVRIASAGKVTLRIATSFIDEDHARLHLYRELGDCDVAKIAERAKTRWCAWLARTSCPSEDLGARIRFNSAMYRVALFPTKLHEPNHAGNSVHCSPYDGKLHTGVAYTNNGFWDTYRTVYPLLAQIDPEGFGEILEGFLNGYRQGGWFPKWASPGYRDCMVGTHLDAVVAEAIACDIPGFDRSEAYEAIRRNAFESGDPTGRWGRLGLADFDVLGYVPCDRVPYSVCRTLDFSYCDWCVARVAESLGRTDDATRLDRRAKNYRNLWHAETGFMRPRLASGDWQSPWSPLDWGGAYIEGSAWQHSWTVPHDLTGLAELAGGQDILANRLESVFSTPPRFNVGTYPHEIHEMTEMALARDASGHDFGQYAHSNQPSHNILWQLGELGRSSFAQSQIQRVCRDLYTPDTLPGDEDNGEMSAWYLLNAIGAPRPCPGRPNLQLP